VKILIPTKDDLRRIENAAAADGHLAPGTSHFIQDERGEVRGAASLGGVTCLLFWSHTQNDKLTSIHFANAMRDMARATGKPVLLPCTKTSPFNPLLPGFGFKKLGEVEIWQLE
jgi:hypothetical protein